MFVGSFTSNCDVCESNWSPSRLNIHRSPADQVDEGVAFAEGGFGSGDERLDPMSADGDRRTPLLLLLPRLAASDSGAGGGVLPFAFVALPLAALLVGECDGSG